MIKVGIVGISGYSGLTVLELLLKHPQVRVTYVSADTTKGPVEKIWPHLKGKTTLVCDTFDENKASECNIVFLAVPHTVAMGIAPKLLKNGKRVIDISADYRLTDVTEYEKYYGTQHKDKANLSKAVYGLPELFREKIKKAELIANPGCYPTSALLGLLPLMAGHAQEIQSIVIDAKSGVSGAGRKVSLGFLFPEVNENFKAYKVLNHQHTPEINLYLSKVANKEIDVTFVPHLLPVNRGILSTIYVQFNDPQSAEKLYSEYVKFYKTEKFVRVLDLGEQPELKSVVQTNYCDIGLAVDKKMLVVTSAIDNLVKGAAGQAVQNMNIMCGFKEDEALL
ncbi:MAG: N-acetyl-gamma-glutamyl-phosphate reductase [Omnitrophica WOR_2 bacterium GWA2_47_8]|nr:MAG: N-acetyl-gamma-glutamyl-phosphate reductase [Omnitrophica WOR_2 bacterium GWA2_47_8]